MTRTARATYPRAVIKDRSESRSGLDSSMRKSGAGHHNWGSIADEFSLESAAMEDEGLDVEEMEEEDHEDMTASGSSRCKRVVILRHFLQHLRTFPSPVSTAEARYDEQHQQPLRRGSRESTEVQEKRLQENRW